MAHKNAQLGSDKGRAIKWMVVPASHYEQMIERVPTLCFYFAENIAHSMKVLCERENINI